MTTTIDTPASAPAVRLARLVLAGGGPFDESKHPRRPKGDAGGGEFTGPGGGGAESGGGADAEDGSQAHAHRLAADLNEGDPRDAAAADVDAANAELDAAESDYRVVPDEAGRFEARPLDGVLDDVGEDEFEVRYDPVDGKWELGTAESHNADEGDWPDDPPGVADRMNARAADRPIRAAEVESVNEALESAAAAGSGNADDLRFVPSADGRRVTTDEAESIADDFGAGWRVRQDRSGRLYVADAPGGGAALARPARSAPPAAALALARLVLAGWDPSKHPRHPKGSPGGGRFAPKAGGDGATPAAKAVAAKVAAKAKVGINKVGRAALAKARQLAKEQAKVAAAKAAAKKKAAAKPRKPGAVAKPKPPPVTTDVAPPAPVRRVKAYAGATDAAVEVHARVLEAAALPQAVMDKYSELGRRREQLHKRYDELLSEVTKDKPVRGAKAEFARVTKETGQIYKARAELFNQSLALEHGLRDKAHAAILFDQGADVALHNSAVRLRGEPDPNSIPAIKEGFDFVRRLAGPGSPLERTPGHGIAYEFDEADTRASAHDTLNRIKSRRDVSASTVAHEAGHHIEFNDPDAKRAANAFLNKRLAESGESVRPLNDIARSKGRTPNYEDDETGFEDGFHSPYVGKRYSDGDTEVISMGVQRMYDDPAGFAKQDPEYFQMIITVTQGNRRKL